jgi:hypothetical protein
MLALTLLLMGVSLSIPAVGDAHIQQRWGVPPNIKDLTEQGYIAGWVAALTVRSSQQMEERETVKTHCLHTNPSGITKANQKVADCVCSQSVLSAKGKNKVTGLYNAAWYCHLTSVTAEVIEPSRTGLKMIPPTSVYSSPRAL